MTLGELLAKLKEIPDDYPMHATVLLSDDAHPEWEGELSEVSWDDREMHGLAPDDPKCCVWLYRNSY